MDDECVYLVDGIYLDEFDEEGPEIDAPYNRMRRGESWAR